MFKNWLRRKFYNLLKDSPDSALGCEPMLVTRSSSTVRGLDYNHQGALNFRMFGAHGGTVIEFSKYDQKADRHNTSIHIVPENADFGAEVAKIITMEQLKNF